VAISIVGGLAWDATGMALLAFVPIGVCAFGLAVLPLTVKFVSK
jgi:hypothetical protein